MTEPLVTVVIPTRARPALLLRAVDSCRALPDRERIEVLVVANGDDPEGALAPVVARFPWIRTIAVQGGNGNIARNAGLDAARGRFVRFLDDDDFLDAAGAGRQHAVAAATDADVCSGAIRLVDPEGVEMSRIPTLPGGDLVAAVLSPDATTATTAHVYRRAFLADLRWDPHRPHLQDVDWMHSIIRRSEARWSVVDDVVGSWQHHRGQRVSTGVLREQPDLALRDHLAITFATLQELRAQGRLDESRRVAVAQAIWHYAHLGFPLAPLHWTGAARIALGLAPSTRPDVAAYRRGLGRHVHPILLEWMLLPVRWFSRLARAPRGAGNCR